MGGGEEDVDGGVVTTPSDDERGETGTGETVVGEGEVPKSPSKGKGKGKGKNAGGKSRKNMITVNEPDEFMKKIRHMLHSHHIPPGAKARRIIFLLEDVLTKVWFMCRHVALLMDCFKSYGHRKSSHLFGTFRVDLLCIIYNRIVDLHNFEMVLKLLTPFETACLYCRVGILNVYNPCKPEGAWQLDLSHFDERIVAKTLCLLSTVEPGVNWTSQEFRWQRNMDPMPGWELTQMWMTGNCNTVTCNLYTSNY